MGEMQTPQMPNPPAPEPKKKRPVWQVVLGIILVVIGLSAMFGGCSSADNNSSGSSDGVSKAQTSKEAEDEGDYTIKKAKMDKSDGFATYIKGSLTNNTDTKWSYVQVTYIIYDKSGDQVGTAMDNLNGLKPGKTWKFKAIAVDVEPSKADSFELDEVSYW